MQLEVSNLLTLTDMVNILSSPPYGCDQISAYNARIMTLVTRIYLKYILNAEPSSERRTYRLVVFEMKSLRKIVHVVKGRH